MDNPQSRLRNWTLAVSLKADCSRMGIVLPGCSLPGAAGPETDYFSDQQQAETILRANIWERFTSNFAEKRTCVRDFHGDY